LKIRVNPSDNNNAIGLTNKRVGPFDENNYTIRFISENGYLDIVKLLRVLDQNLLLEYPGNNHVMVVNLVSKSMRLGLPLDH